MDERIVEATIRALSVVNHVRFFKSERGYQGRFFCELEAFLYEYGVLSDSTILEMEYQKTTQHGTSQRPDIILHIPVEASGAAVGENNFAVWALKHRASAFKAQEDFGKLDEMFEYLCYPLGIFSTPLDTISGTILVTTLIDLSRLPFNSMTGMSP